MHSFTDNSGRSWTLVVDGNSIEKVFRDTGHDLFDLPDPESTLHKAIGNPRSLIQMLWSLIDEQAEKAGVSPKDFGKAMFGDCIVTAQEALARAAIDFFPKSTRASLTAMVDAGKELRDTAETKLKEIEDRQLIQQLTEAAKTRLNETIDAGMAAAIKELTTA